MFLKILEQLEKHVENYVPFMIAESHFETYDDRLDLQLKKVVTKCQPL